VREEITAKKSIQRHLKITEQIMNLQVGWWRGACWKSTAENTSTVSLQEMLKTNGKEIFEKSKYKPAKYV
jgi:hypothetical protein